MAVEIRLCDEDRQKYGGPEWLPFDQDNLDDVDSDTLMGLEEAMGGYSIPLMRYEYTTRTARSIKAACWLARQLSPDDSLKKPSWTAFKIKPLKAQVRKVKAGGAADADPPPESSPTSAGTPA